MSGAAYLCLLDKNLIHQGIFLLSVFLDLALLHVDKLLKRKWGHKQQVAEVANS